MLILWLILPSLSIAQRERQIAKEEVGAWLNQKSDCPADPLPYFWRFDSFDFKGDGNREVIVVASTCMTGTAGPDIHSVIARDREGSLVEWKIAEADRSTYDNLFGNRNYDLAVKDGTLVATFEDDPDRGTAPLVIKYKRNGDAFEISSITKTGVFPTSYDCAKAVVEVERAICHVRSLASLDRQLSTLYKSVWSGLSIGQQEKLKSEQRDWLRRRDRECEPYKGWISCIAGMYQNRIAELSKRIASPQKEIPPTP
ncbi:MAG TPA: lysozyme inhibitor LprI family protein [Terriglobales bacterium]|nr:lysozyme inhibitor LprI family protein [Terriglobales bacterium]